MKSFKSVQKFYLNKYRLEMTSALRYQYKDLFTPGEKIILENLGMGNIYFKSGIDLLEFTLA